MQSFSFLVPLSLPAGVRHAPNTTAGLVDEYPNRIDRMMDFIVDQIARDVHEAQADGGGGDNAP